jgi:hypothetical protein
MGAALFFIFCFFVIVVGLGLVIATLLHHRAIERQKSLDFIKKKLCR